MIPRPQLFVALWLLMLFPFSLFAQDAGSKQQTDIVQDVQSTIDRIDDILDILENPAVLSKDSVISLAQQALELSQNTADKHQQAMILLILGRTYQEKAENDQALVYLKKSLEASRELDDKDAEAGALRRLGIVYFLIGESDLALDYRQQALERFQQLGDTMGEVSMLIDLGSSYLVVGDFEKSADHLLKAEKILLGLEMTDGVKKGLADVYNGLAGNYGYKGDFPKTSENLLKARFLFEELGDSMKLAITFERLGQVQMIQVNYPKAMDYYRQSLAIEEAFPVQGSPHYTYRSMGELFENMQEYDSAILYYRKAFFFSKKREASYMVVFAGANLPKLYYNRGMYDSAQYFNDQTASLIDDIQDVQVQGFSWQNLGRYNLLRGEYRLAEEQLLKAYEFGKNNSASIRMDVSGFLHELYKATGNYKEALKFLEVNKEMKDSIFNEEQIRKVTELEAGFEHEKELLKKEGEIALLTVKEEVANLRLFIGIVAFVILTFGLIYRFKRNLRRRDQKTRELEEISQFKEAMTGMIAHDLKNPLSLVMNSNSENAKVKQAAGQMLQLVTNMLDVHKFESSKVTVTKEDLNIYSLISSVKKQVFHLLSQKNLSLNIMSEPAFSVSADQDLLERVLVNLLTNAIKYSPVNGTITLHVIERDDQFCLSVSDEGPGIAEDQLDLIFNSFTQLQAKKSGGAVSTGLGLTFCKLALEAHGSQIKVSSVIGEGTTFSFVLEPALGEVAAEIVEVENPLVAALQVIKKESVAPQINRLKTMKLYEVSEIRKTLMEVKSGAQDNQEAVELWIDSVLNAAYQGNDQEYDRLVEALVIEA